MVDVTRVIGSRKQVNTNSKELLNQYMDNISLLIKCKQNNDKLNGVLIERELIKINNQMRYMFNDVNYTVDYYVVDIKL